MPKREKASPVASEQQNSEENTIAGQHYTLKSLVLENDSCPIEDWLKGIKDTTTKQRIQSRLDRIERGNLGDCHPVGEGVSEFRLHFGPGYRIYYAPVGAVLLVLLVGGDKSTQESDVIRAQRIWKDTKDETERYERDVRR